MKRKGNLSEELYKMRKLMNFNPKDFKDNVTSYDRLMEEKMVEKYLLSEQIVDVDFDAGTAANTGGKGTVRGNIGVGFTGKEKDKKATQEDIANLGEDTFSSEILEVLTKVGKSTKITEEQAKEISKAFVEKAQVKGSETNKKFKQGLLNGTLNFKKALPDRVELDVLGTKVNASWYVNGASIKGGDGTETPEIPVYAKDGKTIIYKNSNPLEISKWVTNQNIALFKSGEQQYYLTTFGKKGGELKPKQSGFFMAVKGETIADGIVVVGVGSSESAEGTTTPGTITEKKIPVDLVVEMGEAFTTDFDTFKDPNDARTTLLTKIKEELNKKGFLNLDITDISVVSSASNYYGGVVEFTHDKSGNPVKSGVNFNQPPTKTNDTNVDKNNLLAWNRGLRILNLLKQTNGTDLGGNLGKVTILDDVNERVEWRVTDTGGDVDPAGKEGAGQYAKLFIKGVAMIPIEDYTPPTTTPGSNEANLRQGIVYLDADSLSGGIRMATWFSLYQGKYDKTGRFKPRSTDTFTGLPKWLDRIIYPK